MPDYPSQMNEPNILPDDLDLPAEGPPAERSTAAYEYSINASTMGSSPDQARKLLYGSAAAAFLGALFSGFSTSDFVAHLDRQVHSIHCSFIPGASAQLGESGCRTVMMSPYSSLFRESMWGGLPISLLALAVFCYLLARSVTFSLENTLTKRHTTYLLAAWTLPVIMSVIYGLISASAIGALCKLCVGVYLTSAVGWGAAFLAHRKAPVEVGDHLGAWGRWFAVGCAYVLTMVLIFLVFSPKDVAPANGCGSLVKRSDDAGVMLTLHQGRGQADAVAVLDPLCPACRAFDKRIAASGLHDELAMKTVLFPLDNSCNWMVKDALHPGACKVSEALLCDEQRAPEVMAWAFEHQEEIKDKAKTNPKSVHSDLLKQFPHLKGCLGSGRIKNKLNKSLRWAVANALPVLTPQLFVEGTRVCDEDTDLGLEYTVAAMVDAAKSKGGR